LPLAVGQRVQPPADGEGRPVFVLDQALPLLVEELRALAIVGQLVAAGVLLGLVVVDGSRFVGNDGRRIGVCADVHISRFLARC